MVEEEKGRLCSSSSSPAGVGGCTLTSVVGLVVVHAQAASSRGVRARGKLGGP